MFLIPLHIHVNSNTIYLPGPGILHSHLFLWTHTQYLAMFFYNCVVLHTCIYTQKVFSILFCYTFTYCHYHWYLIDSWCLSTNGSDLRPWSRRGWLYDHTLLHSISLKHTKQHTCTQALQFLDVISSNILHTYCHVHLGISRSALISLFVHTCTSILSDLTYTTLHSLLPTPLPHLCSHLYTHISRRAVRWMRPGITTRPPWPVSQHQMVVWPDGLDNSW